MRHSHSIVGGTLLTGSLTSHAAEVGGRGTAPSAAAKSLAEAPDRCATLATLPSFHR